MLKILFILYVINLICDYPLQDDFLKNYKEKYNYVLFVHSMIWAGGLSFVLMYFEIFEIWKVLMLLIGHMIIDEWKCRGYYEDGFWKKFNITDERAMIVDQSLHIVQILLCLI